MSCSPMGHFLIKTFKTTLSSRFSIQFLMLLLFEIGKLIVLEVFTEIGKNFSSPKVPGHVWAYLGSHSLMETFLKMFRFEFCPSALVKNLIFCQMLSWPKLDLGIR